MLKILLLLLFISINIFANSDYFKSLYYTPYDAKKIDILLSKYDIDQDKDYLEMIFHVASIIESPTLKEKIISTLKSKNKLNQILTKNSYRNFLILENLNLLKKEELELFKKDIKKMKDEDMFYQRIFEIKNRKINIEELFKKVTNVDLIVNNSITNANNTLSAFNNSADVWLRKNDGSEGLLNLFIYSYSYSKKYNELRAVFKEISENPYLWEFLEKLYGGKIFENDFYEHLYNLDEDTYAIGYISNLHYLSEDNYLNQNFIDAYYFSLRSFKTLIKYHEDNDLSPDNFKLFLQIKSNFKKVLGKVLIHFQSNGDKKTYNKIMKESLPLVRFNIR